MAKKLTGKAAFLADAVDISVMKDKVSEDLGLQGDLPKVLPTSNNLVMLYSVPQKWRQTLNSIIPNVRAVVAMANPYDTEEGYSTTVVLHGSRPNIVIRGRAVEIYTWVYDGPTCQALFNALNIDLKYIRRVPAVLRWPSGQYITGNRRRLTEFGWLRRPERIPDGPLPLPLPPITVTLATNAITQVMNYPDDV